MSAVIIRTRRPLLRRISSRLLCAYLRFRIAAAQMDIRWCIEAMDREDVHTCGEEHWAELVLEQSAKIDRHLAAITQWRRQITRAEAS